MEQHSIRLAQLIAKYINHSISSDELKELRKDLSEKELESILFDFEQRQEKQDELLLYFEAKKEGAWENLQTVPNPRAKWSVFYRYTAVAATLLLAALSWYVLRWDQQQIVRYNEVLPDYVFGQKNDVSPGKMQTLIELANGETLVVQDKIIKIGADGVLDAATDAFLTQQMENIKTISTPKASNIEVWLPDNTRIWLNASSTLTMDKDYNVNNRTVHLDGEAFFEVAKDRDRRFMVISDSDTVAVYGTSFNVNRYGKRMATTLLEGKVRMQGKGNAILDLPVGYQGRWRNGQLIAMKVDVKKYSSWKEGYFYFKQDNLNEVVKRMADWYDIEIQSEVADKTVQISGTIDKKASLAEAVSILKDVSGLQFTIDNRTLKITK
ncbi:FecR family protein [Sphingobacterium nematocida]|uniref:FecR family protein n=1 Tax=Sphingobacterium nematocida TaxID=1513896 RepID=A0A1T5EYC0_9SPHI|nr:FecR family protein [Sphingobacterium nematocida]SKB88964.1 FecR family protein [Sphingobacterium nematocida]